MIIKKEFNDSFRMAFAQIDKKSIVEAISRFNELIKNNI